MKKRGDLLQLSLNYFWQKNDNILEEYSLRTISMTEVANLITSVILLTQLLDACNLPNLESTCQFDEKEKANLERIKKLASKQEFVKINQSIINNFKYQLLNKLKAGLNNDGKDCLAISNFKTTLNLLLNYNNIRNKNFPNFLLSPSLTIFTQFLESLFKMFAVELIIEKNLEAKDCTPLYKESAKALLNLIRENKFDGPVISLKNLAQSNPSWWNRSSVLQLNKDWDYQAIDELLVSIIEKFQSVIFNKELRDKFIFFPRKDLVELDAYIESLKNIEPRDGRNFKLVTDKIGDLPEFKNARALNKKWHETLVVFQASLLDFKGAPVPEKDLHKVFLQNYYKLHSDHEKWSGFGTQLLESKSSTTSSLTSSNSDSLTLSPSPIISSTGLDTSFSISDSLTVSLSVEPHTLSLQSSSSTSSLSTSNGHESSISESSSSSSIASSSSSMLSGSINSTFLSPNRKSSAEIKDNDKDKDKDKVTPVKSQTSFSDIAKSLNSLLSRGSNPSTTTTTTSTPQSESLKH